MRDNDHFPSGPTLRLCAAPRTARLWLAILLFSALPGVAPTIDSAAISGRVVDASGAALPGTTVTLANAATGLLRRAESSSRGEFLFPGLPVNGEYRLRVQKKGFQTFEQAGIELRAGQPRRFWSGWGLRP